tara:strand:+ start:1894 stop:3033 length:1140 start_codon:yes stop_codon:yes gene_type:complete
MITSIFATKDATLYEATESLNTGNDAVLEVSKVGDVSGSQLAKNFLFNTRALVQFDLTSISSSISSGEISSDFRAYLNLYTVEAKEVPREYELYSYPISQSWTEGSGRFFDLPANEEGCSWKFRFGKKNGTDWGTGSISLNPSTGSFTSTPGGGAWFTGSSVAGLFEASQSFSNESTDVRMDVTKMVKQWITGSANGGLENNGFIVKRSDEDEQSSTPFGRLMFYSGDTNTVYLPRLEIAWDDSTFSSGNLEELTSDSKVLYLKNNRGEYHTDEKIKVRVNGRDRYPVKTFATQSSALTVKFLPTSSYYAVKDAHSEETIIPFDTEYTKLSCDSSGNFFKLWMKGLQPERYYRFIFRVDQEGGSVRQIFDDNYIFKVVR